MTTQPGENVAVYAVQGNFDDAQTGVKLVFGSRAVQNELAQRGVQLSSANSINWGRLVPQIVYCFTAYQQLLEQGTVTLGDKVDFCVPTGNLAISWPAGMQSGWACPWGCWYAPPTKQCAHRLFATGI